MPYSILEQAGGLIVNQEMDKINEANALNRYAWM